MNYYTKDMKRLIERILTEHSETRNNDIALYRYVLKAMHYPTDLEELHMKSNIFMTITRNRQKIQETNPFLGPTDIVKERRRMKARGVKEWSRQL